MNTVIIAAAPITKEKFDPVYAEFPISDTALLRCIASATATEDIMEAACKLMGMDAKACVTGMYCRFPDRINRPFEVFMMDLRKRYKSTRDELARQQEEILRQRRQNLFQAVLAL